MSRPRKKKHYPPALYRYREAHPTISVVLTKEMKSTLDQFRKGIAGGENMSYAAALKHLALEKVTIAEAWNEGYQAGLSDRMERGPMERGE
jgi:hypothetical protein